MTEPTTAPPVLTARPVRWVALGDSTTEGAGDPDPARPNDVRGWADIVAEQLTAAHPETRYAKPAVRGRLLRGIADRRGCLVLDYRRMRELQDWRYWAVDRLHMSAAGHTRVAAAGPEPPVCGGGGSR